MVFALRFILAFVVTATVGCSYPETFGSDVTNNTAQLTRTPPVELTPEPNAEHVTRPTVPAELPKSDAERRLGAHFERYKVAPVMTIDSQDSTYEPDSPRQLIKIGSHQVEWLTDLDDRGVSTRALRINGVLIPLEGEKTLNQVDENGSEDVGWVNDWWQIRLYKLDDRELLGIEMNQSGCTGLGCSVSIQLVYDLKTKKRNYFGTFRTDSEIRIFRFAGENEYFYVSRSCDCVNASGEYVVTYNIYKMRPDGEFVIQNAPNGKPYFIRHSFYPAETEPYTGRVIPPKEPDKLEHGWIRPI